MNAFLCCLVWLGITFASFPVSAQDTSPADYPLDQLPDSTLVYVSDYFSFVGQDSQGSVVFALDNSRGRDGETYQAQHLLVLHDAKTGWARLNGNNAYENVGKELTTIPGSQYFQFQGTPKTGLTIIGESNQLRLTIEPIPSRFNRRHDAAAVWMGSAPAVLTWRGRVIPGRVIYEYLRMPDFNRLTHTYWDLLSEYHGFYLKVGTDDVYLHRQRSERLVPLMGFLDGFMVFNGVTDAMKDVQVEVRDYELARGFYRWPSAWRITWTGPQGPAVLMLKRVSRTSIWNWAVGGFSMVAVEGELEYGGKKRPVYGLVEVIT